MHAGTVFTSEACFYSDMSHMINQFLLLMLQYWTCYQSHETKTAMITEGIMDCFLNYLHNILF